MPEIDISGPDRQIGSMLSGEEVEKLREAINWIRRHRGLRLKEIAQDCDATDHTVRNFAYRKSVRPDSAFLGRLYKATGRPVAARKMFTRAVEIRPQCVEAMRELRIMNMRRGKDQAPGLGRLKKLFKR